MESIYLLNDLFDRLRKAMLEEHAAVNDQNQPLKKILNYIEEAQFRHIMQQYALFAKMLFHFIERAQIAASQAQWTTVAVELADNVAEELGRCTSGIPHHVLLAQGLEKAFGMPMQQSPSVATQTLLHRLNTLFEEPFAYVLGAVYAVEATSVPELKIVWQALHQALGQALPEQLEYFFEMHINEWEPEHEQQLRMAIAQDLPIAEVAQFKAGFQLILSSFDQWWQEISMEALLQKVDLHMRAFKNEHGRTQRQLHPAS